MIVRMSKVEIVGPKALLEELLSLLRDLRIFHLEPATIGFIEKGYEEHVRSFLPDEKTLSERLFLEDLRQKLDELFSYLPKITIRKSYIEPLPIIDTVSKTVQRHVESCRELYLNRDALEKEVDELRRYTAFLGILTSLLEGAKDTPDLEFIGLMIKEPGEVGRIRELISQITDWKFELVTETAEDGTLVGLITVEKEISERLKKSLSDERIPELTFPPSFEGLTFPEKIAYVKKRITDLSSGIGRTGGEMEKFARRWMPIYGRVKEWIDDRLSLLTATACAFETRMCFFINGWMPSEDVKSLGGRLAEAFGGRMALEEKEIREEDIERIPVVLKNPPYFRPFELFVKLLPLPKYTSFDPTPFIGIFFPIFFGIILGDAGYGAILIVLGLFMMKRFGMRKNLSDASKILLISSVYTILFGILYGEYFGELGRAIGLNPLLIERRSAVMPMLYFAITIGVAHTVLGLFLGFMSALRKKTEKEAAFKLLMMLVILCIAAVAASFFGPLPRLITRPAIIATLILTPLLFFAGGLLSPLELVKSIGNIISYARIMAIGMASVFLAFVANHLAGMAGNIVIGIIVAGLLHSINIILGVFSPTIQSLRLHYVEFFSKFLEHGGRRFEPLQKEAGGE